MSCNVPREEEALWRKVAADLGEKFRSRGHLQKMALLLGLEQLCPNAAKQLREIRRKYYGSTAGAIALCLVIGFAAQCFDHHRGVARRGRMAFRIGIVRNLRWEGAASA